MEWQGEAEPDGQYWKYTNYNGQPATAVVDVWIGAREYGVTAALYSGHLSAKEVASKGSNTPGALWADETIVESPDDEDYEDDSDLMSEDPDTIWDHFNGPKLD